MTTTPVPTITDEQIAEIEALANDACQYAWADWFKAADLSAWFADDDAQFMAAASPFALLAVISRLRAAERYAALLKLYGPIIDEVERRAEKECCLQDRCDFTVTVSYDDYAAIDQAMKGEQQ